MTNAPITKLIQPPVLFPAFTNSHQTKPEPVQLNNDVCRLVLIYLAKNIFTNFDYNTYKNTCAVNKTWNNFFNYIVNQLWKEFPLYPIIKIDTLYRAVLKVKPNTLESEASKKLDTRQLVVADLLGQIWREEGVEEPLTIFRKRFESGAELHFIQNFYLIEPEKHAVESEERKERLGHLNRIFQFFLNKIEEDAQCAYLTAMEKSLEKDTHSHPLFIVQRLYSKFKILETQEKAPLETSFRNELGASPVHTLLIMRGFANDRQILLDNCYQPHLPNETLWNHPLPVVIGSLIQWEALQQIQLPDNTAGLPPDAIAPLQIQSLKNYYRHHLACEIPVSLLPFIIRSELLSLATQATDYFIANGNDPAYVVGMLRVSLCLAIPRSEPQFLKHLLDYIIEKSIAFDLIDSTEFSQITLLGMLCEYHQYELVTKFLNTLNGAQHPFDINLGEEGDDRNTPLHFAINNPSIWSQLINAGADYNIINAHGETAILNHLAQAQKLEDWQAHLPTISFTPIQGEGLEKLRENLKKMIALGRYKPNFAQLFTNILTKALDEAPTILNEDNYTSLFFASVIFCFDHPVVKAEIENFKNDIELMQSSEFLPVAEFSDQRHITFLQEWLEVTMERPISWFAAASALWIDDCFKGVPETIKDSIFSKIYSKNIACKYSLKEIRPLILILNGPRINLFKKDLEKIIQKTNKQKEDLVSWLAIRTQKPLNVCLIEALVDQGAKLDVLKVIDYMKATYIKGDLLNYLLNQIGDLSAEKLRILENTLKKWIITYKEIDEHNTKHELMANIALLEGKIREAQALLSPGKKRKGQEEAMTPSPLKRTKTVYTPQAITPRGEKRGGDNLDIPKEKRRLTFPTPPPKAREENSSPSSNPEGEDEADFTNIEELFQGFHSDSD